MGDHSRSNPHDLLHVLGFANVCRACKSFLSKCYPERPTILLKKAGIKTKIRTIEDHDAKICRFKIHMPTKKHNPQLVDDLRHNDDDPCRRIKGSYDDNDDETSPGPSRLSRNLSHGQRTQTPAKALFSRSLSHREAAFAHSLSRSTSKAAPIIFSNSNGLMKPPAMEKHLDCTLEELCFGCIKNVSITRNAVKDNGHIVAEDEVVTIKVEPGWRKGTKITFEGKGNQRPGAEAGDVIFVIAEKDHSLFKREEDDLQLGVEILLVDALTGCTLLLPLLGGESTRLTVEDIVHPGYEKAIEGEGMPKQHEPGRRGNLIINISVKFPEVLTEEQRSSAASILQQPC